MTKPILPEAVVPDFVVVDVETACSRVSSICQIGIVGFKDGVEVLEYEALIDPRDEFSYFNTRIHGITAERVVGQPSFGDIHAVIDGHLSGRVTVAHSNFDKGALRAACAVHSCSPIETCWLDSVRVAKQAWPELPSHRLNVLSKFLGVSHRHHDALSDARAAGMVVVRAIEHTGIGLAGWMLPTKAAAVVAPKPSSTGPLRGQRVAILGARSDGPLSHLLAGAGARIVRSVGKTTTTLVISRDQPYGRFYAASADYRRAEELRNSGSAIEIVAEDDLLARLAVPLAS